MAEDPIRQIWKRDETEEPVSHADLVEALRPRVGRGQLMLRILVWMSLAIALVTLVLEGMNIVGYARNATMLPVHVAATAVVLGIVCYGVILMGQMGELSRRDRPLAESVRAQLDFFRIRFEIWIWAGAVVQVLFVLAVGTLIDNQGGTFRINRPWVFWGTLAGMMLFFYGTWKVASLPVVQELRATLEDLQNQLLDKTTAMDRQRRHWRRWGILLVIVLLILLLLGAWQAMRMTVP